MLLGTTLLLSCLITAGSAGEEIVPMGENSQNRLQTVVDGLDSRGEGFAAMIDHVRAWTGSAENLQSPNTSLLLESPQQFRGNLFAVSGIVELSEPLQSPWVGVQELFVRDSSGNVFGLYVVGQAQGSPKLLEQSPALFYKTMSIEGRDNQIRLYPTFVTTVNVLNSSTALQEMPQTLLVIPILCILAFSLYLFIKITAGKTQRKRQPHIQSQEVIHAASEVSSELPDTPSEALEMMFEQSESNT